MNTPSTDEKALEKDLREWAKKEGGLALKWVNPWFTGVPDRIVLLPGRILAFVELKSGNGRLSARQKLVFAILEKLGWPVWVIDTKEKLENFKSLVWIS